MARSPALAPPGERFFGAVAEAAARVLMLDYDGTLAPFVVERDQARPYRGVERALARILRAGGTRLVVVTGRALADLDALLAVEPRPEVWASHGWESRTSAGRYVRHPLPSRQQQGLVEALRGAQGSGIGPRCEVKPASIALHWRGLAPSEARRTESEARALWTPLEATHGLTLTEFDGGLELRVPGRHKGTAVREILAGLPSGAAVAYLGDDLTDEDAFRALPPGGLGVLVRAELRPSAAGAWLRPPGELLEFLNRWADVTGSGP